MADDIIPNDGQGTRPAHTLLDAAKDGWTTRMTSPKETNHLKWMEEQGFSGLERINFDRVEKIIPVEEIRDGKSLYRELHIEKGLKLAFNGVWDELDIRGRKETQFSVWDDPEMSEDDKSYLKELGFYHLIGRYTYFLNGLIPKTRV